MKKLMAILQNNIGLKLISVLIAIVIWYVVVDIDDPVEINTYQVKITVENEAYIANGKQIYHIDDSNKAVGVSIRANRSTLKNIREEDITVIADLTQIVDLERDPVMVPLRAECRGVSSTNMTLSKTAIPITIETIASKTLAVAVDTKDSVPSEEYEVGRATVNPDQIVVSGPESIISQIDSAIARIDVTGMTIDSTRKAELILLGKDQSELSKDTVQDDLTFEGGYPDLSVSVELWERRNDVTLDVSCSGMPANGYHVEGITTIPETLAVVGNAEALQKLAQNGNMIHVPDSMVSIEDAVSNVVVEIKLEDVMPENMRMARNTADTAAITVTILSDQTKDLTLDVDDIRVDNLDTNLALSYSQAEFVIRIRGAGTLIDKVTPEVVTANIDMAGQTAGEVTVPVTFELPPGVSIDSEVTITVTLKEKVKQEETPPDKKE